MICLLQWSAAAAAADDDDDDDVTEAVYQMKDDSDFYVDMLKVYLWR